MIQNWWGLIRVEHLVENMVKERFSWYNGRTGDGEMGNSLWWKMLFYMVYCGFIVLYDLTTGYCKDWRGYWGFLEKKLVEILWLRIWMEMNLKWRIFLFFFWGSNDQCVLSTWFPLSGPTAPHVPSQDQVWPGGGLLAKPCGTALASWKLRGAVHCTIRPKCSKWESTETD